MTSYGLPKYLAGHGHNLKKYHRNDCLMLLKLKLIDSHDIVLGAAEFFQDHSCLGTVVNKALTFIETVYKKESANLTPNPHRPDFYSANLTSHVNRRLPSRMAAEALVDKSAYESRAGVMQGRKAGHTPVYVSNSPQWDEHCARVVSDWPWSPSFQPSGSTTNNDGNYNGPRLPFYGTIFESDENELQIFRSVANELFIANTLLQDPGQMKPLLLGIVLKWFNDICTISPECPLLKRLRSLTEVVDGFTVPKLFTWADLFKNEFLRLNKRCWTVEALRNEGNATIDDAFRHGVIAAVQEAAAAAMREEVKDLKAALKNFETRVEMALGNHGAFALGSLHAPATLTAESSNLAVSTPGRQILSLSSRTKHYTIGDLYLEWYFFHDFIPVGVIEVASLDVGSRDLYNKYKRLIYYMNRYFGGCNGFEVTSETAYPSRQEYFEMLRRRSSDIQKSIAKVFVDDEVETLLPPNLKRKKRISAADVSLGIEITYKKLTFLLTSQTNDVSNKFKTILSIAGTLTFSLNEEE
jgi:hypothetical protein